MKTSFILGIAASMLMVAGCAEKPVSTADQIAHMEKLNDELREKIAKRDGTSVSSMQVKMHDEKVHRRNGRVEATASVTNNSGTDIDEIVDVVFFDEYGSTIAVKKVILIVRAGQTTYIDVHIGLDKDIPKVERMTLEM